MLYTAQTVTPDDRSRNRRRREPAGAPMTSAGTCAPTAACLHERIGAPAAHEDGSERGFIKIARTRRPAGADARFAKAMSGCASSRRRADRKLRL
jgi:hypothetical protein